MLLLALPMTGLYFVGIWGGRFVGEGRERFHAWKAWPLVLGAAIFVLLLLYPERMCLENVLSAARHGARTFNYCQVEEFLKGARGLDGVRVRDLLTDQVFDVRASVVINASGPWVDRVRKLAGLSGATPDPAVRRTPNSGPVRSTTRESMAAATRRTRLIASVLAVLAVVIGGVIAGLDMRSKATRGSSPPNTVTAAMDRAGWAG